MSQEAVEAGGSVSRHGPELCGVLVLFYIIVLADEHVCLPCRL